MSANLSVNILNAVVSRDTEVVGRMELFVTVKLTAGGRTQEAKTKIIKGRKNELTTWNERLNFVVPRNALADARMLLEVKDEDVTTDDIVGVGWINLQNCMVFNGARNLYEIRLHFKNQDAGILNIETSFA